MLPNVMVDYAEAVFGVKNRKKNLYMPFKRALKILSFDSYISCKRSRGGVGQQIGPLGGAIYDKIKIVNFGMKIISE